MKDTDEKFWYSLNGAVNHIESIHVDNAGFFNEFFITESEMELEIAEDYEIDLCEQSDFEDSNYGYVKIQLQYEKTQLKNARRIDKIRSRKTGTGLSDHDFVTWAKDRWITHGTCIYRDLYFSSGGHANGPLFLVGIGVASNVLIDRSKVWRIVE